MGTLQSSSGIEPGYTSPPSESVSTNGAKSPLRREIELDFIRGIAILMVVDYHTAKPLFLLPFTLLGWTHFGWAGVDIFFVLSGFLVGGLLAKEWKLRGNLDVRRFLVRRGFKIWPQYYVFLLVNIATRHRTFADLWGNFLNIQNYVGGIAHTWTLAVEEHAYLLLALLFGMAATFKVKPKVAFAGVAVLAAAVIAWCFYYTSLGGNSFERTDTRVDGILFGLMLAMAFHFAPDRFYRAQRMSLLWVSILVVTLVYFRFHSNAIWDTPLQCLLADLSGIATLFLLYRRQPNRKRTWLYRTVAWIGLYSYGIYLWHVGVFSPLDTLALRLPASLATVFLTVVSPVAAVIIGVIATRLVEFPTLAIRDRLFPRRVDSAAGLPAEVEAQTVVQ